MEEEQTTQWPKEKGQKDKQRSTKQHTRKTKDRVTHEYSCSYNSARPVINSIFWKSTYALCYYFLTFARREGVTFDMLCIENR
jgi:hypothetical protein